LTIINAIDILRSMSTKAGDEVSGHAGRGRSAPVVLKAGGSEAGCDTAAEVVVGRTRGCCAALSPAAVPLVELERLAGALEVLAHPIRLRLLAVLAANPGRVCVCDLEPVVPVKQPTVSHHLRILREAGLVDSEREGVWAYYRLRPEAVRALAGRLGGLLAAVSAAAPAGSERDAADTE
jgi:ArsR family transcriptional regulator